MCAAALCAHAGAWAEGLDPAKKEVRATRAVAALAAVAENASLAAADLQPTISKSESLLERGLASWYGAALHRRRTASGERFDMHALTAAHPWLPFGSQVCVRSLVTGKTVVVRINDRGPRAANRIIDLSRAAAQALGMLGRGTKPVALTALKSASQDC